MNDIRPQSLWHLVEMLDTNLSLPSGLVLPDGWWKNFSTAIVLASGPGLDLDGRESLPPVAEPGDLILFSAGDFKALEGDSRQGFVYDLRIAGWVRCDPEDDRNDRVLPANDWVMIRYDERPSKIGNIFLPERTKRRRSGIVIEVGPGRLVATGPHKGTRLTVEAMCGRELIGSRVFWSEKDAEAMCAGRTALEYLLVKAEDLLAVEWEAPELVMANVRFGSKVCDPVREIGGALRYGGKGAL